METQGKIPNNINCKFLNLGFDILSRIYVLAQNPNLSAVSKFLYEIGNSTSVQIEYNVLDKKQRVYFFCAPIGDCDMVIYKKDVLAGLIRRDILKYHDYLQLFRIVVEKEYMDLVEVLLAGSRVEPAEPYRDYINHTTVITSESDLYSVKPLIDINNRYSFYQTFSGNVKLFKLIEDAHKIQIDVINEHRMSPKKLIEKTRYINIHEKLSKYTYILFLKGFIENLDYKMVDYVLERIELEEQDFGECLNNAIYAGNKEMVEYIINVGKNLGFGIPDDAIEAGISSNNIYIIDYLIEMIGNLNISIYDIMEYGVNSDNVKVAEYYLDKGGKVEYNNYQFLKQASSMGNRKILNFLVDRINLSDIDSETKKELLSVKNIEFFSRLLDKGLDVQMYHDFLYFYDPEFPHEYLEYLQRLLDLGVNIYANESSILKEAVRYNDARVIRLIMKYSKKPHIKMESSFDHACANSYIEIASLLMNNDKSLAVKCKDMIYDFAIEEKLECLELFLKNGADMNTKQGRSIMSDGIRHGNKPLVSLLLRYGVEINYDDKNLFEYACKSRFYSVVKHFLEIENVSKDSIRKEFLKSCFSNHYEMLSIILNYSSYNERNILFSLSYGLPLNIVSRNGSKRIVDLFLEMGTVISYNRKIFLNACKFGYDGLIARIVNHWKIKGMPDKKIINKGLLMAVPTKNNKIAQILLEYAKGSKAKILRQNTLDELLVMVCDRGDFYSAKKIIEMGSNIDSIGNRTLLKVFLLENQNILNLLIENGLENKKIDIINFFTACKNGSLIDIQRLINSGVDINVCDSYGLKVASESGNLETVRLLLKNGSKFVSYLDIFYLADLSEYSYDDQDFGFFDYKNLYNYRVSL
ncbi:hypothetical protein BB559_004329 [Furculomyces boomerangus]|uniref:Uncharacterized protein n=2 Tax=Harpellales TaxID=61421 RepID=A0A2T9YFE6_9FUNG|nr:hypothetical protein BB559_004329 [Furculomyces boomerangus]PVZ99562.1 hypothetical protein BB558_004482 [Smittium angustum]